MSAINYTMLNILPPDIMLLIVKCLDMPSIGKFITTCKEAKSIGIDIYSDLIGDNIDDPEIIQYSIEKYQNLKRNIPEDITLFTVGLAACIMCEKNYIELMYYALSMREFPPEQRTMICINCINQVTCADCTYVYMYKETGMNVVPACPWSLDCCYKFTCSHGCIWSCSECRKLLDPLDNETTAVMGKKSYLSRYEKLILCMDCKETYYDDLDHIGVIDWCRDSCHRG